MRPDPSYNPLPVAANASMARSINARIQTPNFHLHQGGAMIERNITLPEMILWTGTRVPLGAGIGILIARRLSKDAMKAARLVLTVVGGLYDDSTGDLHRGQEKLDPARNPVSRL